MRKIFFLISIFLILIILGGVFLWQVIYLPKTPGSENEAIFNIEKGQGSKEIAHNLEKEGLIKWGPIFQVYAFFKGVLGKLQAGKYLLSPSMNIPEIIDKFVKGDVIKEKITIIEGWNLRDIAFYFEQKGMFRAEEFFELVGFPMIDYSKTTDLPQPKDFSQEFDFLKDKLKNLSLEGYLFPDTYEIQKGETLEEIIRKMLQNFDQKLEPELKEEIAQQNKTIFEIVTMASLLEKEVKTFEDKKLVSGILWKRLENKIPLQVDATITFIKKTTNPEGVASRPYGARISIEETQIDSPYNTYKYLGLPLGPISNPGLESIIAAISPQESEYWYYLSPSAVEEKTVFSKTLEEHNLARAKYLKSNETKSKIFESIPLEKPPFLKE